MNPQNSRKPFYILDPTSVINHEAVAQTMRDKLITEYQVGGVISSSHFRDAYVRAFVDGVFDYTKFKSLVRGDRFSMFSDEAVQRTLKSAIEMQMQYGFDLHTINALREQGNVSFLLSSQLTPELQQIQDGIVKLIRQNFKKEVVEVKENDWSLKKKLKENSLTIVQQTDKKTPAQKMLDFADLAQENGMGFSPKIITPFASELVQFDKEQKTQKKVGERVGKAGIELFLLGPKTAELTTTLPGEVRRIVSLKDVLLPRGLVEGAPPLPGKIS
ncbi:MAG: hypothetical protein NTV98_02420 [Candidatus Roizmanbacteria bacterium]|nr:hypothetical protein [Candidatus Roizmanbacteria bacterium]